MTTNFRCPHCNAVLSVKKGTDVQQFTCSVCGRAFYTRSKDEKPKLPWTTRQPAPDDIVLK